VPPLGWQFLPAEVAVDIDGATDDCSRQHDINFVFAGFGVVGQLLVGGAAGQQQQQLPGPPGVQIDLLTAAAAAAEAGTVLQTTVTDGEGRFVFTAVPGAEELVVRATHAAWQFAKATGAVTMTGDNGVAESLLIRGFDVTGRVVAAGGNSQPMAGVSIFIFGPGAAGRFAGLPGCADADLAAASEVPDVGAPGLVPLCRAVSGPDGAFVFPVVPPGTAAYRLVPYYRGELTRYEVIPTSRELTVGLDSVRLAEPFVVAGFSVRGRVLRSGTADKEAMAAHPGTIVTLEGGRRRYEAKTDAEGFYSIEKLEAGTYVLTAAAEGIEYPKVSRENIMPVKNNGKRESRSNNTISHFLFVEFRLL
jgi:hypothetical protein